MRSHSRPGAPFALAFLVLLAAAPLASAQDRLPFGATLGVGFGMASGAGAAGALHLQFGAQARLGSPSTALRLDGVAQVIGTTQAIPSCIPGTPRCDKYSTPYPGILYAGTLSLLRRHGAAAGRLYSMVGGGAYHGGGYKSLSERYGTAAGVSAGVGIAPGEEGRGLGFEVRYHHLIGGLGGLRSVVAPAITLHF